MKDQRFRGRVPPLYPLTREHPVAEPRGAAGGRSSKYHQSMSPCGGECRVGRPRCRADVAVWRRVSCWSLTLPRGGPSSPAHAGAGAAPIRGTASIARSPPTNDRRRPPRGGRPLPHRAPHRRVAQLAHPAGRSRMLIALHRLAPVKASDAISPLNAVVEPGCCRTPPAAAASSAFAATARAPAFAPNRI